MNLTNWYLWSDLEVFSKILKENLPADARIIIEVAAGPNIVVPYLLKKISRPIHYISIDTNYQHLLLQRQGVEDFNFTGIVGDAKTLPFKDSIADVFVFHHAIDDILETAGLPGLKQSIAQALRVLKPHRLIIFSHCVFSCDPYTSQISLGDVKEILGNLALCAFKEFSGPNQDWLVAKLQR